MTRTALTEDREDFQRLGQRTIDESHMRHPFDPVRATGRELTGG